MNKLTLIFFLTALAAISFSCTKKKGCTDPISIKYDADAEEDDGSCLYGGTGGSVTLVAFPEHHLKPIISKASWPDSAFIKFNTSNSPGNNPSDYDMIVAGEVGEEHVHIEGLKPGKYFIMMAGLDTTASDSFRVTGGIPVTITQSSGEMDLHVPVTE